MEEMFIPQYVVDREKRKISVTVDQELVEWIDKEIAERRFSNRSHAVCYALAQLADRVHA